MLGQNMMRRLLGRTKQQLHPSIPITIPQFEAICFDAQWYAERYPDSKDHGTGLWDHYKLIGARKGYNPCEFFWTSWYLEQNPDVFAVGINPLEHYEMYGALEGRRPSPGFDTEWYLENYHIQPDANPLEHFLHVGRAKGYRPNEKLALAAFQQGDGSLGCNQPLHIALESRLRLTGKLAYHEDLLTDGNTYLAKRNLGQMPFPELEPIAHAMVQERAYCVAPYLAGLENVIIIPGSTSLIMTDATINDEIVAAQQLNPLPTQQKLWNSVWVSGSRIAIRYKVEVTPHVSAGIHLFKEHEQNYFHFVAELMPKLYLLEKHEIDHEIPLLVSDDLDVRLYEIIDYLKNPNRSVVRLKRGIPYAVDNLIYLSDISNVTDVYNAKPTHRHTFMSEHVLKVMSDHLTGMLAKHRNRHRKIYLSRDTKRRTIINEREIVENLVECGFEIVSMETLTFRAQVELFSNADVIVGGSGAAFTNLLWCREDTKAIILYSDHEYNNTTFWDRIAAARNIEIRYVFGKRAMNVHGIYAMHDDFSISISELQKALA